MTIHTLERRPEADRPKDRARRSRLLSLVLLILSLLLMA